MAAILVAKMKIIATGHNSWNSRQSFCIQPFSNCLIVYDANQVDAATNPRVIAVQLAH